MLSPAANPTEVAFRAAGQFNGFSPLDETVAAHREAQRSLDEARREVPARMHAEIMELRSALALKDEAIALLRDALTDSEAELDTLRGLLVSAGA